jgi:hypothetical protein
MTLFMSPRMTVPCQMAISLPMKTSPTMVALGATKTTPSLKGVRLYRSIMFRARLTVSLYLRGASKRWVAKNRNALEASIIANK